MFKKNIIVLILAIGFAFSFFHFFKTENIKANSTNTVSGWAWSGNIGWISLNCNNSELSEPRCVHNYGVNIRNDGTFEGYAWSDNIGWINFAPTGPFPDLPNYSARVDLTTGDVSGWARVLAYDGGWNGWIKLRGTNYGVSINTTSGEFDGFAWSNMVVGWINFNGVRTNPNLFNQRPSANTLDIHQQDYCLNVHPKVSLSWIFQDPNVNDKQLFFQIQIDNNANFSSPVLILNTPKIPGNAQVYHTNPGVLSYDTTYYWRLKVWDTRGAESDWITGPSFTTPIHSYPIVDFISFPRNPVAGETVQFINRTRVSDPTPQGRITQNSWSWNFQDGNPSESNISNPTVVFTSTGSKNIIFRVTDSTGFSCKIEKRIDVHSPLPKWREVIPFFNI